MPRHYIQQTESPAPPETAAPAPAQPVVIIGEGGLRGEEQTCAKHGTMFLRCWIPRLNVKVGQCPDCQAEEELIARADAELAKCTCDR